jgi:superfamily II DNA or RNA helicase
MSKIEIFCLNCNYNLGDSDLFAFYEKLSQGIHLTVKIEKRNLLLEKFSLEKDKEKTKKNVIASVLICKCKEKLGKEINIGPKDEPIFCIKKEAIYIIKSINSAKRPKQYFDKKTKWIDWLKEYPEIEYRDINNFYGINQNQNQEISNIHMPKIPTNFPNVNEIFNVNIASLVDDAPRTYQIELYMAALCENTIIYLPTGSGKTLVAAMCSAYMKIINPNKKIIFVCDKIPLVFQQGYYLERQCNLSVGKFCSESKDSTASEITSDILVFTADFLINLLLNRTLYLGNCCLLIIDEIHHARDNHSFSKLIEMFYNPLDTEVKPRVIGMTASPGGTDMEYGVNYLCKLINGRIYLPLHYQTDFENSIYRPEMEYCLTGDKSYEENRFLELVKKHVTPFLQILNPLKYLQFEPRYEGALKDFLNSKITEANINKIKKIS